MHPEKDEVQYVKRYQRGGIVKRGTVVIHKCVRTESSKVSFFTLQQTKILESSWFSNRHRHCTTLPCENGGNKESNVTEIKQRNLTVSLETPDQNYCRIPIKFFECGGRLAVSKKQGPIRMETLPKSVLASLPEERNTQSRFFASRLSHQLPQYFAWKRKPLSQGTDALQQIWGNQFLYAFSPFCLIVQALNEWITTKQKKCCLSHQFGSLKSGNPFY